MIVTTAGQMQELDRRAIKEWGIPGVVLMENAGRLTYEAIREHLNPDESTRVLVVAGKGNNGGDGFVIARHLFNNGIPVKVALLADPDGLKGDALVNYKIIARMGIEVRVIPAAEKLSGLKRLIAAADLIVDAIFGTGLTSDIRGHYAQAIKEINKSGLPVAAVDIPSGLNSDTGAIMGVAVEADLTVTYGLPKIGQVLFPGADLVGDLVVADISLPGDLLDETEFDTFITEKDILTDIIPERAADAHKGSFGHLFVLAGSPGKTGAAAMAARAALRAGAGLVTLGVPRDLNSILEVKLTEEMTVGLPQTPEGLLSAAAGASVLELLRDKSALVLGPGMGQGSDVTTLVRQLVLEANAPTVIDADGLNALAADPSILSKARAPIIVTPHPGEMARLIKSDARRVQADRLGVARGFARSSGAVVVLKGAHTVVADPDGIAFINICGNPGMASAGVGDVLTGIIGGLLAQGVNALDAAVLGVYLHGQAGDLAAENLGEVSLVAQDLIETLPQAIREINEA